MYAAYDEQGIWGTGNTSDKLGNLRRNLREMQPMWTIYKEYRENRCKGELVMKIGDKVNYYDGKRKRLYQNGIVKALSNWSDRVFVVYSCDGDWDNYQNYMGELTYISDLMLGWKGKIQ